LAAAAVPLVARLVPTTLPIAETPGLDIRMLAVAAAATMATGLGFGLLPALRMSRSVDVQALRQGTRAGSSRGTERLRASLVVVEVMASVVLLVAAGLLVQAMWRVQQIEPGFRTDNVLTLRTTLPVPRYGPTALRQQFYDRVVSEIEALPGVVRAAYISFLPMTMRGGVWPVLLNVAGLSPEALESWSPDPKETRMASLRFVTPGLFDALDVPLLAGRVIGPEDTAASPRVAVVSGSMARQLWPDRDPLGETFFIAFQTRTVVGVVGDVRVRGLERESEPQVYLPASQMADHSLIGYTPKDLVVRAAVPVSALTPQIRDIIRRADPQQPISDVRPLADIVTAETAPRRAQVRVLAGFAAVAFVLAGIGLHGLLAFAVSSRTREIGVRMALGAQSVGILTSIVGRGLLLSLAGIVAGAAAAYAAGLWLQSILVGVSPADPPTYALTIGLVLAMTLLGSLLPAMRAMRVDPVVAMREE
jgi:predicted permease